jgi:hypothetical protein
VRAPSELQVLRDVKQLRRFLGRAAMKIATTPHCGSVLVGPEGDPDEGGRRRGS